MSLSIPKIPTALPQAIQNAAPVPSRLAVTHTKKFLVQFECAAGTRWLVSDTSVRDTMRALAGSIGISSTDGPEPRVTVIQEDEPQPSYNGGHQFRGAPPVCVRCGEYPNHDTITVCPKQPTPTLAKSVLP